MIKVAKNGYTKEGNKAKVVEHDRIIFKKYTLPLKESEVKLSIDNSELLDKLDFIHYRYSKKGLENV